LIWLGFDRQMGREILEEENTREEKRRILERRRGEY
jgi:hypothetical protein